MKSTYLLQTVFTAFLLAGCYEKNLGPRGDVTSNGSNGQWQLSAYTVKNNAQPIESIPDLKKLAVTTKIVKSDSVYDGNIYKPGYEYQVFSFADQSGNISLQLPAMRYDNNYHKNDQRDEQWFRINDETGFWVVMDVDVEKGLTKKIQISNVMKSDVYQSALDTARYVYIPQ